MYASLHLHKQHYQKWSLDRSLSRRNQVDLRAICWHNFGHNRQSVDPGLISMLLIVSEFPAR